MKRWWAAVHPDDREQGRQALLDGVTARAGFELELRLRRADAVARWFRVAVSPIDGGLLPGAEGWLGICTDIDDYKRQGAQFAFLARAGEVLAESLDLQATLDRLFNVNVKACFTLTQASLPQYEQTRKFYLKHGYEQHALIKDFYTDGDSMVIFRKHLKG